MTKNAQGCRGTVARRLVAAVFAGLIALLGWLALSIEFERSVSLSLSKGRGWPEALFLYFRYFTVLTNAGIAALMSLTAIQLVTRRRPPPSRLFNAALVYILVTCVTYELLLRSQWNPRGLQFLTDLVIHDIQPALVLLFWLVFAPRDGVRWRDALWMLAYPAAFFTMTLIAGALGAGYPYDFFDADKLGYAHVIGIGLGFIIVFYVLGLATTAVSIRRLAGLERRRR